MIAKNDARRWAGGKEKQMYGRTEMDWETRKRFDENKPRLRRAFAGMRKANLIARMNFSCCGGCGSYDLGSQVQAAGGERLGYVFYHQQNNDRLESSGRCCISFGPWYERDVDGTEPDISHELHDERTKIIGAIAVAELVAAGIKTDWNGDPSHTIEIDLTVDATGLAQEAAQ